MTQPEFDADAALNRILTAITPYRSAANNATTVEGLQAVTSIGMGAAMNALGEPLTEQKMTALLFAAVLRLADFWNADDAPAMTIPDTLPEN